MKCIVGDGPFLYAGTNNGEIYDLTQGVPRCMSKVRVQGMVRVTVTVTIIVMVMVRVMNA